MNSLDLPHRPASEVSSISEIPTAGKRFHEGRKSAEKEFRQLRDELATWQRKLYATE